MGKLNTYATVDTVSGDEVLVAASADGTKTLSITTGQVAGAPQTSASTGKFYANKGANISRVNDRLLIAAASDNPGKSDNATASTDWLTTAMAATSIGGWPVYGATAASIARYGTIGLLGASRTSDAKSNAGALGYTPSSIGIASWAIDDDTSSTRTTTAYAFYGEVWRKANVVYQPSFAMELECVNLGGVPTGESTPYHVNNGGGTYGIQIGAGGGQTSGTSDAEAAITIVSNPSRFRTGLIIQAGSPTGDSTTDGSGYGTAISMGAGQIVEWATPETVSGVAGANTGFSIQSQVTAAADGGRIIAQNGSVSVTNSGGHAVFSVEMNSTPDNTLNIQAGTGSQAPGIYVTGSGSQNLGLFPGASGEIVTQGLTTASGSSLANNEVPALWLHINVNGQDLRIPLFTPAQAGG